MNKTVQKIEGDTFSDDNFAAALVSQSNFPITLIQTLKIEQTFNFIQNYIVESCER